MPASKLRRYTFIINIIEIIIINKNDNKYTFLIIIKIMIEIIMINTNDKNYK